MSNNLAGSTLRFFFENIFAIFFVVVLFFSTQLLSHGPRAIGPEGWEQFPPQEINVSVYDQILNSIEPLGFKGHGNVGAGVDGEILFWNAEKLCGLVTFIRVYDFEWAADASGFLGEKLKKLCNYFLLIYLVNLFLE